MRRKYKYLLVTTAASVIFALVGGTYYYLWMAPHEWFDPPTDNIDLSSEEMEIYEAVVRYQILHSAAGGRRISPAFVIICDKNPPAAFLERFDAHSPPVYAAQRYKGMMSVLYVLGPIDRPTDDSAIVSGGYHEGPMSASGNTYHLRRIDGVWKVVEDEMHWIS